MHRAFSRREALRVAFAGVAGLNLAPSAFPVEKTTSHDIKRYWLFPHPDGSECPNIKKKGILLVDIDEGLQQGRWRISYCIETPLLSRIGHGNGPGVRGATVCAATNRCYISCSDGRTVFYLVCVDLGSGRVIYEKEVPGIGRLQITPDGDTVFLPIDWFGGQSACAVDAATGEVKKLFAARYLHHLAIGRGGEFLYAPYRKHPDRGREQQVGLHVIDTRRLEVVHEILEKEPGRLLGSEPHIQVDAEDRVYSYCRMKCAMCIIEPRSGRTQVIEHVKLGELWPQAPQAPSIPGQPALTNLLPSYHGIGFLPDGKRAWIAVEGNVPDMVEWDLAAQPPRPVRAVQGGPPRRAKGWAFISRRGDVICTSNGRMFAAASGKLLGEVQYDDGTPLYSSKLCEVHLRGEKVVFGSSSVACGYPPEAA
jgi:hypothetical protein